MDQLANIDVWISLLSLAAMEIVLGIDNIVFITILCGRVPIEQREFARRLGIGLALGSRLALLFALSWVMKLTAPLFTVFEHSISGRDLILLAGGMFLMAKATLEIHHKLEGADSVNASGASKSLTAVVIQIAIVDIVFSLDSVITAVGMADQLWIMVAAMIISVVVMLAFARIIGDFVEKHPSIKVLALSFLLLIGAMLVGEGFGQHIPKGYIYFAMAFSLGVEVLNLRRSANVVKLRNKIPGD
jgi:predicted tellurium resistance membrane protein TerC